MTTDTLNITLDCSSGAELLFGGIKKHDINLEGSKNWCVGDLLNWLRENKLTGRADLFMQGDTVRPGLLVLINDTDWELMGELNYKLQAGDNVLLISTLHGG